MFASSLFHKSVGPIQKSKHILQQVFKKMISLKKEKEDALFCTARQVDFQMIKYLSYFPIEIITRIQQLNSIKRKI